MDNKEITASAVAASTNDVKEEKMDVDEVAVGNEASTEVNDVSNSAEKNGTDANGSEDESDSEDEVVEPSEPLATTRSRRANAGNRMSTLILEEEDEFYTKNYGGFQEEEDDDDFDEEEEVDDEEIEQDYDVDSDFDIDETDEIAPEHQATDEEPRKRKAAYREPKRKVQQGFTSGAILTSTPTTQTPKVPRPGSSDTPQSPNKHRPERTFRDSTKKKTAETIKNIESVKKRRKYRNIEPQRRLTQTEMLEEAKITEEENIKSLEMYQRLESEKLKKIKMIKKSIPAPFVTYYSSVFTNPETKERYSRNLCTFVGCEPRSQNEKTAITSRT